MRTKIFVVSAVVKPQGIKEPFENHESYDATFALLYPPVCSQWRKLEICNDQMAIYRPKMAFSAI